MWSAFFIFGTGFSIFFWFNALRNNDLKTINGLIRAIASAREMGDANLDKKIEGIRKSDSRVLENYKNGKTIYVSDISLAERIDILEYNLHKHIDEK